MPSRHRCGARSRARGDASGSSIRRFARRPSATAEPRSTVAAANDLDDEVEIGRLVHQLEPVIGGVGEQTFHPGPALADGIQDYLRAGAIGDVGRRQVNHQQTLLVSTAMWRLRPTIFLPAS